MPDQLPGTSSLAMRTAPRVSPGYALARVSRSREPRTASKVMTVGSSKAVAQATEAPSTGTHRFPSHTAASTEAGRLWIALRVKETSARSKVLVRPKSTQTQPSARAPLKPGSRAVAALLKAGSRAVAGC
jgi:hypothetical protein